MQAEVTQEELDSLVNGAIYGAWHSVVTAADGTRVDGDESLRCRLEAAAADVISQTLDRFDTFLEAKERVWSAIALSFAKNEAVLVQQLAEIEDGDLGITEKSSPFAIVRHALGTAIDVADQLVSEGLDDLDAIGMWDFCKRVRAAAEAGEFASLREELVDPDAAEIAATPHAEGCTATVGHWPSKDACRMAMAFQYHPTELRAMLNGVDDLLGPLRATGRAESCALAKEAGIEKRPPWTRPPCDTCGRPAMVGSASMGKFCRTCAPAEQPDLPLEPAPSPLGAGEIFGVWNPDSGLFLDAFPDAGSAAKRMEWGGARGTKMISGLAIGESVTLVHIDRAYMVRRLQMNPTAGKDGSVTCGICSAVILDDGSCRCPGADYGPPSSNSVCVHPAAVEGPRTVPWEPLGQIDPYRLPGPSATYPGPWTEYGRGNGHSDIRDACGRVFAHVYCYSAEENTELARRMADAKAWTGAPKLAARAAEDERDSQSVAGRRRIAKRKIMDQLDAMAPVEFLAMLVRSGIFLEDGTITLHGAEISDAARAEQLSEKEIAGLRAAQAAAPADAKFLMVEPGTIGRMLSDLREKSRRIGNLNAEVSMVRGRLAKAEAQLGEIRDTVGAKDNEMAADAVRRVTRLEWLDRLPTAEEVQAHAGAEPIGPRETCGLWLCYNARTKRVMTVVLHVRDDRVIDHDGDGLGIYDRHGPHRWLRLTAEGVPAR